MSILPGHEDLKPKAILGFDDMGFALVHHGDDSIKRYKMFVGPGGRLHAEPYVEQEHSRLPDQLQKPQSVSRLRNYDQG
jgi:hypothetical protein